jgi:hypothetical protein
MNANEALIEPSESLVLPSIDKKLIEPSQSFVPPSISQLAYDSIDSEYREIRLIELEPEEYGEMVKIFFLTKRLDEPIE